MKYLTIIATALILSGCAASTSVVENNKSVASTTNQSAKFKEPKRRVNLSQAEILCNQSLLPGKERYSYYCQFRKPPVATVQQNPLDPNVTVPDYNKLAAKPQTITTSRNDIVSASPSDIIST